MSKFMILAIARSGSTSLAWLLGESPDVQMCIEPFNPDHSKYYPDEPNYIERVVDKSTLDKAADEVFSKFTALKTLNYQLDTDLNTHLMKRPDLKVLHLYRRDVLSSLLSAQISKQTGVWHMEDITNKVEEKYKKLKPLDIEWLKGAYNFITTQYAEISAFLMQYRQGDYMQLYYEDLYSNNMDKNKKTITEICNFLNINVPNESSVEKYMMVSNAKLNFKDQYEMIPNYREILDIFNEQA